MRRCAWFLTDLKTGGGERLPLVLLPEMPGFEGTVVLFKNEVRQEIPAGVRVIPLGGPGGRLMPRLPWLIGAALRASRGADLLVGGLEGPPIVVAAICGFLSRRPAVGVVPTHLGRLLAEVRMSGMERSLLGWALRRCRAVVTASADGRDALIEAGVDARRVRVIANPVTPWAFTVVRAPARQGVPRLLTVGRLEPAKGLDVILEAARRLPDVPFEWEIVGEGTQAAALRALQAELGLEGKVRFTGLVADLAPHFARADLFVSGSRLEGMPIAVLEAMACGIPVVATRSGRGVEEALANGDAGLLVPADDPHALARAIRELLQDPEGTRALGERARRRARDFAPATIAAAYAEVFAAALGSA